MKLVAAHQLTVASCPRRGARCRFAWLCRQRRDWPADADAASRFVLRTDVKCYYASIDHLLLMGPTCFLRRKVTRAN
jgi:hypothetical protein